MKSIIIEHLIPETALKRILKEHFGCRENEDVLRGLRILAIYLTDQNGYMVVLHLVSKYRFLFVKDLRMKGGMFYTKTSGDANVKKEAAAIAEAIGAKLLMES